MWAKIKKWLMICVMIFVTSCSPKIIKHPDTPMLITGASWGKLEVSVYSKELKAIIDYGTIRNDDLEGWWLVKYSLPEQ